MYSKKSKEKGNMTISFGITPVLKRKRVANDKSDVRDQSQ